MIRRWKSQHNKTLREGKQDGSDSDKEQVWNELSDLGGGIKWFGLSKSLNDQGQLKRNRWRQIQRYFVPSRSADFVRAEFTSSLHEKAGEEERRRACGILDGALGLGRTSQLDLVDEATCIEQKLDEQRHASDVDEPCVQLADKDSEGGDASILDLCGDSSSDAAALEEFDL